MADLRVVMAGAGGRMGRTIIKAISETPGVTLTGALEGAGSPLIGQDAGVLAGLAANNIKIGSDAKAALANADAVIDFTIPKATVALAALTYGDSIDIDQNFRAVGLRIIRPTLQANDRKAARLAREFAALCAQRVVK